MANGYGLDLIKAAEKFYSRNVGFVDILYEGEHSTCGGKSDLYPDHPREFHFKNLGDDDDASELLTKELKKAGIKEKVVGYVTCSN